MTYTPGPWKIFYPAEQGYLGIDTEDDKHSVVVFATYGGIQSEANARLIATAPDLLAACLETLNLFGARPDIMAISGPKEKLVIKQIAEAISKATHQ